MAAFHGDLKAAEVVRYLATLATGAVETGTFLGDSAVFLAEHVREVATCEIRQDFYQQAAARLSALRNVRAHHGRSQEWIEPTTRDLLGRHDAVLIFLDAHWQDEWPLHAELVALERVRAAYPGRLIVMIDDLQVPGRPNFYGSAGGGGTPGHPMYGPRTQVDRTDPSLGTFGHRLAAFLGVWAPRYDDHVPGYLVASDLELRHPLLERLP